MAGFHPSMLTAETNRSVAFRLAFGLFVASILFRVAGMGFLKLFPSMMSVVGPVYPTLVKAPTWTFMVTLAVPPCSCTVLRSGVRAARGTLGLSSRGGLGILCHWVRSTVDSTA